jgi:hypothetical protein
MKPDGGNTGYVEPDPLSQTRDIAHFFAALKQTMGNRL